MKKEDKDFLILEIAKSNLIKKDGIIYAGDLRKFINQLEEPEKVVIPQFVAEVIEKYKEHNDSLGELLASVEHATIKYYHNMEKYRVDFDNLYKPGIDLCAIIARAWIDGFVVEKEKLYKVELPIDRLHHILTLHADGSGHFFGKEHINNSWYRTHLTEQEIKSIDERFWVFAEEMER